MSSYLFLPLVLGLSTVTQGILNRGVAESWGLVWAVFLNAAFFLVVSVLLLLASHYTPQYLPEYLRISQFSVDKFKWWFLIPGFCGFCIVICIPWSLQTLGPSKTFVFMIVAQIIFSLLAEKFVFDSNLSVTKVFGAVLAMAGAALVAYSPSSV